MGENNKQKPQRKATYEELKDYCDQLAIQNRNLRMKLNQVMDAQNKLPYLFEIIKMPDLFGKEVVSKCIDEINVMLFSSASEPQNPESKEGN